MMSQRRRFNILATPREQNATDTVCHMQEKFVSSDDPFDGALFDTTGC
jgi:hypothetical protein